MINASILALTIGSFSNSPLITSAYSNLHLSFSTFNNLFSSAYYSSKNIGVFVADRSIFKNIIGSGIILESKSYSNQVFKDNLIESSSTVTIQSCLFTNCIALNDNGGGLQVSSKNCKIKISQTGFSSCKSTANGGAFYTIGQEFSLDQSCITMCSADEYDAFYFWNQNQNEDEITSNYIYSIIPSSSSSTTVYFDSGNPKITNNNFTSISKRTIASILEINEFTKIAFEYNSFISCAGKSILYFHLFGGEIRYCNFDGNSASEHIAHFEEKESIRFSFCCFMNDNSKAYSSKYSWFQDCTFDHPFDQDKFPFKDFTVRCTFDSKYTTNDIEIPDISKNGCWNLVTEVVTTIPDSKTDNDSHSSFKSTLYIVAVVALIIIVAIIAFFIYRWWNAKRSKDYMLTMYAQV